MKQDVGLTTALRAPVQDRSKASYERMLAAAEALFIAQGSDNFTLQDVSRRGKVSIGSIYSRFGGREALLHAVHLRVLERVDTQMAQRLDAARQQATNLNQLVVALIDAVAETLRDHGNIMRPMMQRASVDPVVAANGKASYAATATAVKEALLLHADEIRQPDPIVAVDSAYRVLYAAIARYLGFGTSADAARDGEWDTLKRDLGRMIAAFLGSDIVL